MLLLLVALSIMVQGRLLESGPSLTDLFEQFLERDDAQHAFPPVGHDGHRKPATLHFEQGGRHRFVRP